MKNKNLKTFGRVTHLYSYGTDKLNNCNDEANKNIAKNENGITLISIIVTIVVLIILAGISIGAIAGDNGIIAKTKAAKEETGKMQNSTTQDRDALYGELVGEKNQYEEAGTIGIDLQLAKQTDTSIIATASATDTKSEIISYNFYIRKIIENDSAYVTIKNDDKVSNTVTCSNLEKDMGYKVKVVAMDKEGVSKTAEKNIVLGEAIKISVVPISGPDSYPSTVMVTATSVISNMDYIELPNGEKVEAKNGKFKLKTTYNSTKNGPIVFTAYDKDGNVGMLEYEEQNVINFETEWTFAEETTITVPVTGTVDVYIDYGDGTKENVTKASLTHTYTAGTYTMKISGKCGAFAYNPSTKLYLTKLIKWGCLENTSYNFGGYLNDYGGYGGDDFLSGTIPKPHEKSFRNITTCSRLFNACSNLKGNIPYNLFQSATKVNSMSYAFSGCSNLTGDIPQKLFENCVNVKSFAGTFYCCENLTGNISEKLFNNCINVVDFSFIFAGCKNLTGNIPVGLFENCKLAESFNSTFRTCYCLTGSIPKDLFKYNIKATNFGATFYDCINLTGSIPTGFFANNTEVKDFGSTFLNCNKLTGNIPLGLFKNKIKSTSYERCFERCSGLTGKIPEDLFENCPSIITMNFIFNGCSNIDEIPSKLFYNVNNGESNKIAEMRGVFNATAVSEIPEMLFEKCTEVTAFGIWYSYGGVFQNCRKITSIPEGLFKNCTKVKDMSNVFSGCSNLNCNIPENLFTNCTLINNFYSAFANCSNLTGNIPVRLFINCSNVTSFANTFRNCANLTGAIPADLFKNNAEVTTFESTFEGCKNLTDISVGLFDNNSKVTTFKATFSDCSSLKNIPEGLFDNCQNVEIWGLDNNDSRFARSGTFSNCTSLTGKAPELWNRTNVKDNYFCFNKCTGLDNYSDIPNDWK